MTERRNKARGEEGSIASSVDRTRMVGQSYFAEVRRQPLLTREQEVMLARRSHAGDRDAAALLIRSHLRLVIKVASRYRNYGLPMNELIQEGNIGLIQAVERFDPERGVRLATYAMWWIKAAIQDYILRSWSLVRIGTTAAQKALFFNLRRLKAKIRQTDESLSFEEVRQISQLLGVRDRDVLMMEQRLSSSDQSLNMTVSDEGNDEWIEHLASDEASQEETLVARDMRRFQRRLLRRALDALTNRERLIIRRRHLTDATETLESLGKELGISKERVRQIEARAMKKLAELVAPELSRAGGMFTQPA